MMPRTLRLAPLVAAGLVLGVVSAIAPASVTAQTPLDTVQIRTTPLGSGVYMLTGSGGNIGLAVGEDAVFVVDDQFAPLTAKILGAIAAVTPKPVKFVLNTHWHFDHTGGNENFGKAGALIVAQERVRQRMSTGGLIEAVNRNEPPSVPGALPVVTFTDAVTFHINGDSVVVTHSPHAHTDGDAIVHFTRANVIHTGDTFVSTAFPLVDLTSGGTIDGVIASAERVIAMANDRTRIIPGHGPVADRARMRTWVAALRAVRDRVAAEVEAGRTVEQVLAASIAAPYAAEFPGGHERFIRVLHQELTKR